MIKKAFIQGIQIVSLGVLCCMLAAISGCHKKTEQDKVKKVITDIQTSAEEKEIKKIVNCLSKTYRDPQGHDYDTIKGLLLGYLFRHQKVHVYITNLEVIVRDAAAKAVFQAVLSGGDNTGSAADILPEALGMYSFEVSFVKESGEWMVNSAKWQRVGDGENRVDP